MLLGLRRGGGEPEQPGRPALAPAPPPRVPRPAAPAPRDPAPPARPSPCPRPAFPRGRPAPAAAPLTSGLCPSCKGRGQGSWQLSTCHSQRDRVQRGQWQRQPPRVCQASASNSVAAAAAAARVRLALSGQAPRGPSGVPVTPPWRRLLVAPSPTWQQSHPENSCQNEKCERQVCRTEEIYSQVQSNSLIIPTKSSWHLRRARYRPRQGIHE